MKDISDVLDGWEYEPHRISVRKIMGDDGRVKIQLRLDLGLLQMEAEGRPDGTRPYEAESWLDYYETLLEERSAERLRLDPEDCVRLRMESIQYYHRRIGFFELGEYAAAAQDAEHNLRIMDLIKVYAQEESDRAVSEQYRAFVLMHRTQALASILLKRKDFDGTLQRIDEGIQEIERFFKQYGQEEMMEEAQELRFLQRWREEIQKNKPLSLRDEMRKRLQEAVEREEYEQAARLRDMIRGMEE